MERLARSQVVKGVFLLVLVFFIPFVSSSLRSSYLYVLLNILIVALGAEAGLLEAMAMARPQEEKKKSTTLVVVREGAAAASGSSAATNNDMASKAAESWQHHVKPVLVQKASMGAPRDHGALRRCSSRPSLFFIGGFEGPENCSRQEEEKGESSEMGEISKQELFAKAEAFIGNFYMQLKMQREESWKRIHELYHKAF
ncbi:uncharacterized protein LOC141835668 [Curcuma longa]|uniref:uncharacterized protein LOC141835668 n=1 Tax=Curcuma longa TaxID=136217 RepID=UPI003D9ED415